MGTARRFYVPVLAGLAAGGRCASAGRSQVGGRADARSRSDLTRRDLLHNQLSGPIPSSVGGLESLEGLGLDGNQLSGEIPSSLELLTNLQVLRLDENGCLWTGDAMLTAWLEGFGFTPAGSESAC